MKSTKKRFSEGGTSEDKEAGLKASKGEDVGFFERLRMGNIDDPKSEAFKRLGAGRGAAEREFKNRASNDPTADRVAVPVTRMPEAEVAMPDAPRRVVPQMMAAEQEGGRLSPAESIAEESGRLRIPPTEAFARKAAVMPKRPAKPSVPSAKISSVPPSRVAIGSMEGMPEPEAKKPKEEEDDTSLSLAQRMARRKERMKTSKPTDERSVNQRFKEEFGFKNGGSVSASRGDGIAQRGKTRGKMC
tara:strand:- start:84 stop:818 length:735 start_codon:yes stop_codon:yes gene_type:complete